MAVYSGTPTINSWWEEGDRFGKRIRVRLNLTITLSSQGGASNTIGAAALGLSTIDFVVPVYFVDGSSQARACFLFTDGDSVFFGDPQVATDADRGEPLDTSGTLTFEIAGLPA